MAAQARRPYYKPWDKVRSAQLHDAIRWLFLGSVLFLFMAKAMI